MKHLATAPCGHPLQPRPRRSCRVRLELALGALLGLLLITLPLRAQPVATPTPHVTVSGEGETALSPDMAILSLTVLREAPTASEALEQSNKAMADVIAAMRRERIAERDLQTSGFDISPRYVHPQRGASEPQQPRIVGYVVSHSLSVRVRELARLGEVLDTAVQLGVNQGGNISFSNEDPSEALSQARTAAVKDAMARARTLTEAAGIRLGRVLEIREQSHVPGPIPMFQAARGAAMATAESVPVQSGENVYRVTVQLSFELLQ
ncbi:MAG: SIMPL domain-containing protein [Gammaproteobacteria bacterium]|nr:SIMPL domain-containing protein [Gammaproteobacteria bacterium]